MTIEGEDAFVVDSFNQTGLAVGYFHEGYIVSEVINAGTGKYIWTSVKENIPKDRFTSLSGFTRTTREIEREVANVKNFGASGRGEITAIGSCSNNSTYLAMSSLNTFAIGQGIAIAGAGAAGVYHVTTIADIDSVGLIITLAVPAPTGVTNALVEHDDSVAIQAAINSIMYFGNAESQPNIGRVHIPGGVYNCRQTINLGYGETFKSVTITGDGPKYAGSWAFSGTSIVSKVADRPCFAIQGGRSIILRDLTILGLLRTYIESNGHGSFNGIANDETIATWIDPAVLSAYPNCNSRYAPYAGIAIDPYSGTRPSPSYANQNIPSWMANQTQWGRSYTSDVMLTNVRIEGFTAGVVTHPSGSDGNCDYIKCHQCSLSYNVYGFSVSHTQARMMSIENCNISAVHTALTTRAHGLQNGKPAFLVSNCEMGTCIRWFDMGLAIGGNPVFSHCYGELIHRIGDGLIVATSIPAPITFIGCEFDFDWQKNGMPRDIIKHLGAVKFQGCSFSGHTPVAGPEDSPFVYPFDVADTDLIIEQCGFGTNLTAPSFAIKHTVNLTGSVVTTNLGSRVRGSWRNAGRYNLNSGSLGESSLFNTDLPDKASDRKTCINLYSRRITSNSLPNVDSGFQAQPGVFQLGKANGELGATLNYSASGRTLTITGIYNVYGATTYREPNGGSVGDCVYDTETGNIYTITSVVDNTGSYTWTLYLLNNYLVNQNHKAVPTATGYFFVANSRFYTMAYPTIGDVTAASATIANVGRGDAYGGYISDASLGTVVDDYLRVVQEVEYLVSESGGKVTAITNGSPGSIVIAQAAAFTQARRPLTYFVRKPPANGT